MEDPDVTDQMYPHPRVTAFARQGANAAPLALSLVRERGGRSDAAVVLHLSLTRERSASAPAVAG